MRASLLPTVEKSTLALLWDESHLWGLMLWRTIKHYNIPCRLLRGEDIASGALERIEPEALLVPGGWAKRKSASLGGQGRRAIQDYVAGGGVYIGFCGGAGLALSAHTDKGNLGLCPWSRKPMNDRLVNCSGHLRLRLEPTSNNLPKARVITAPVWWPSQFEKTPGDDVSILASYLEPEDDFWVADLPLDHIDTAAIPVWEGHYGINLNPSFLSSEPCVIQGSFGAGTYILSYAHLETPGSSDANAWFCDLLSSLVTSKNGPCSNPVPEWNLRNQPIVWNDPVLLHGARCLRSIVDSGRSNFLLNWRNSWLLGWRRGVPGFALNTLIAQLNQIMRLQPSPAAKELLRSRDTWLNEHLTRFRQTYIDYLAKERLQSLSTPSSPVTSGSKELQKLREELVGPFPGQAGMFGELASFWDDVLWELLGRNP